VPCSRIFGHAIHAITLAIYAHEFARNEHDDRLEIYVLVVTSPGPSLFQDLSTSLEDSANEAPATPGGPGDRPNA